MKTSLSLAIALLLAAGCSKTDSDNASAVAHDIKVTAVDSWNSIKDFTFEKRAQVSATLDKMSADVDARVATMKAQGRQVPDYDAAHTELKNSLDDLSHATSETWEASKARVERAWDRVKADYEKAKAQST
jgi:hypothetical protein